MTDNSPKRKKATFLLLKNQLLYPNLTTRCHKVEKIVRQTNLKLLVNLTSWKTEYLFAQLRTGFQQKLFRLKTCPQGVLQAQQEKSGFLIFTTSTLACISGKWPLKIMKLTLKTCFPSVTNAWFWSFIFAIFSQNQILWKSICW